MGGRGQRPEGFEPPGGFDPTQMGERPEPPEGGRGQRPEGQRPEGMEERPEDAPVMVSTEFYMTDKVNAFSGVCDEGTNSPL